VSEPVPGGVAALPDAEAVIANYLAEQFAQCAASAGAFPLSGIGVGDRLPADYDSSQPFTTLDRLPGPPGPVPVWSDVAHLDIRAYGPDKATAYALIAQIRPLLFATRYLGAAGAVVQGVDEHVGPQWLPDPDGDYPESGYYLLQVAVTLHP
jgi:hypothetical protein